MQCILLFWCEGPFLMKEEIDAAVVWWSERLAEGKQVSEKVVGTFRLSLRQVIDIRFLFFFLVRRPLFNPPSPDSSPRPPFPPSYLSTLPQYIFCVGIIAACETVHGALARR